MKTTAVHYTFSSVVIQYVVLNEMSGESDDTKIIRDSSFASKFYNFVVALQTAERGIASLEPDSMT